MMRPTEQLSPPLPLLSASTSSPLGCGSPTGDPPRRRGAFLSGLLALPLLGSACLPEDLGAGCNIASAENLGEPPAQPDAPDAPPDKPQREQRPATAPSKAAKPTTTEKPDAPVLASDPDAPLTARDLEWDNDKRRATCFVYANGDAVTDVLGSTYALGRFVALSGVDGTPLWSRTIPNVESVHCATDEVVVVMHHDRSLSIINPRTDTLHRTPQLAGRLSRIYPGDDCMQLTLESGVSTTTGLDGTPVPTCEGLSSTRRVEDLAFGPPGHLEPVGKHTYSVAQPDDVFYTGPAELVSWNHDRWTRPRKERWRAEIPFAIDFSLWDGRSGGFSIKATEGPTFVTLVAVIRDESWLASFDQADGTLVHSTALDIPGRRSLVLEDGDRTYLANDDDLWAYDSKTGALAWSTASTSARR